METELRNNFELAANIWPIINSTSGLIRRIAARAYVLPSGDGDLISDTLSFLGKTDFMIAKEYPLGSDFKTITKEGELSGCVSAATFMFDTERIIRPILEALSNEHPEIGEIVLNIFQSRETGPLLRFGPDSYTIITLLMEDPEGNLSPHLQKSHGTA